jgi:hypothetical protein
MEGLTVLPVLVSEVERIRLGMLASIDRSLDRDLEKLLRLPPDRLLRVVNESIDQWRDLVDNIEKLPPESVEKLKELMNRFSLGED